MRINMLKAIYELAKSATSFGEERNYLHKKFKIEINFQKHSTNLPILYRIMVSSFILLDG